MKTTIIIVILIIAVFALIASTIELFLILLNTFKKHIDDIGIPAEAYNTLDLPPNLYLDELPDTFFIDALDSVKTSGIHLTGVAMKITDVAYIHDVTIAIGQFTIDAFNALIIIAKLIHIIKCANTFVVLDTVIDEVIYWKTNYPSR